MKENDIITVGCDNYSIDGVLQRRNKLKGVAQQKLLLKTVSTKDDISINTLRKIFQDNSSKLYVVEASVIINNLIYKRKSDYIRYDKLPDIIEAKTRTVIKDRTYKICSNCGQKISAFNQWSRRCRRCQNGNFRFPEEKINYDKVIHPFDIKDRVLEKLIKKGYIKQCSFLNKRMDFFRFHDGYFDIFESKNKEKSGLTYSDYFNTLKYPIMMEQSGYNVKKLTIIYNGSLSPKIIEWYKKDYGHVPDTINSRFTVKGNPTKAEVLDTKININNFETEFIPIGKYLKENNIFIEKIVPVVINHNPPTYDYNIIKGKSDFITIDLSGLDEGWNK
jgi:RNA polymerase-binding transcription factor DksA